MLICSDVSRLNMKNPTWQTGKMIGGFQRVVKVWEKSAFEQGCKCFKACLVFLFVF